jgi:glyoxylate/hydroxypyruvate reductase A
MRPTALLVVTGRGIAVDVEAVCAALNAGKIGGAVMDTFPKEPLPPDSPLWLQPGLVVTSHVSGGRRGDPIAHEWPVFMQLVLENLRRFVDGQQLLNAVDMARGY